MMSRILVALVNVYQYTLSAVLGPRCRFYPSCSHYTVEAIETYGAARGSWMGIQRICRCHPLHPGGFDPVPKPEGLD